MDKESSSKKNRDEQERKVFVVNLPQSIIQDDLKDYFSKFGPIEEIRIIKDKKGKSLRGFGFVLFYDRVSYLKVFEQGEVHLVKEAQVLLALLDRMPKGFAER